jgi:hypothetical protein
MNLGNRTFGLMHSFYFLERFIGIRLGQYFTVKKAVFYSFKPHGDSG